MNNVSGGSALQAFDSFTQVIRGSVLIHKGGMIRLGGARVVKATPRIHTIHLVQGPGLGQGQGPGLGQGQGED